MKKIANSDEYAEVYVKVSKDKDMKTLFLHKWREVIFNVSGEQPAYWLDDVIAADRYEMAVKPKESKIIDDINFKALKASPDKTATYKIKCSIEIDDSYYGSFEKAKETHYSFELYNESIICGYMPKNEKSKAVFKKLSKSNKSSLKAVVSFHFRHNEWSDDVVAIDDVKFEE